MYMELAIAALDVVKNCIQCDLCILVLKEMFNDVRAVTR